MISDGFFFNHSLPFPFGYSGAIVSKGVPPAINSVIPMFLLLRFSEFDIIRTHTQLECVLSYHQE